MCNKDKHSIGWKSDTSTMRYLQSWKDSNWLIIN